MPAKGARLPAGAQAVGLRPSGCALARTPRAADGPARLWGAQRHPARQGREAGPPLQAGTGEAQAERSAVRLPPLSPTLSSGFSDLPSPRLRCRGWGGALGHGAPAPPAAAAGRAARTLPGAAQAPEAAAARTAPAAAG